LPKFFCHSPLLFVVVTAQRATGKLKNWKLKTEIEGQKFLTGPRYYSLLNCQFGLTHAKRHEKATKVGKVG